METPVLSHIWNQIRPKEVIIWLVCGPSMSENVYSISLATETSGHVQNVIRYTRIHATILFIDQL